MEIWTKIARLPNYYSFSSEGRILSEFGGKKRFLAGVVGPTGYRRLCVKLPNGEKANAFAHRLIMEAFHGPSDLFVNHKNGVKLDNRRSNLEYVTPAQNSAHANDVLDSYARGEKNPTSRFTDEQVRRIRAMCAAGMRQREIAKLFGCAQGTICFINLRQTWAHL